MEPKTKKILSNICFFLTIVSLVGVLFALRYSYEIDPDPIVKICVTVGLISVILNRILRRYVE